MLFLSFTFLLFDVVSMKENRGLIEKKYFPKVILINGISLVRRCHVSVVRFQMVKWSIGKQPFAPNNIWLEREVEPTDRKTERYGAPL